MLRYLGLFTGIYPQYIQIGNSVKIFICSAGRRVGLLESFRDAAKRLEIGVEIIACDLKPKDSAACAMADTSVQVPHCDDPGYAAAILEATEQHKVDLVVPTIDPDLLPLAKVADDFARIGALLHVSALSVIEVVRDKQRTSDVLATAGVPVPRTLDQAAIARNPDQIAWPVFAKPIGGSASRGLHVFDRAQDIPDIFPEPMIFQDMLQGPEYTVNMYVDQSGTMRTVIPYLRMQTRAGEVEKGVTFHRKDLHDIAVGIARALPLLRGVACFQVIDDPDLGPRVIEINARFGGGYPLADHAGATFAKWLMEEALGHPCSAHNNWRDGVKMMRFDSAVYQG